MNEKADARGKASVVSEKQGSNLGRNVFLSRAVHAESACPMTMGRLGSPETSLLPVYAADTPKKPQKSRLENSPPLEFFQATETPLLADIIRS